MTKGFHCLTGNLKRFTGRRAGSFLEEMSDQQGNVFLVVSQFGQA